MSLRHSLCSAGCALSVLFSLGLFAVPATAQIIRPALRSGSEGTVVRELQATLQLLGYYSGEVTGKYDEATVIAVYQFQKAAQLPETGVADQTTWSTLFPTVATSQPVTPATETPPATTTTNPSATPTSPENLPLLKEGMNGESVTLLQKRLKTLGYFSGVVDGVFGPRTLEAVIAAQTAFKLDGDGIVGSQTWQKLLE